VTGLLHGIVAPAIVEGLPCVTSGCDSLDVVLVNWWITRYSFFLFSSKPTAIRKIFVEPFVARAQA
jgi:hypothetical protein